MASRCGSCQCLILSSSLFSLTCKNKPTPAQESLISRAKPPQAQSPRSARAPDTDDKNLASPCIYDDPLKNALSVLVALSINSNYLTMDGWKSIQPSNPWLEALEQASSSSLLLRRKSYETIYSTRNQYPHTRLPCWGVLSGCKGIIACLKSLEKSIDSFFVELCTFLTIADFTKVLDVFSE